MFEGRDTTSILLNCCSVFKLCLTLCDPMGYMAHQAPLSFTIFQSSLKLTSTELVMPSNHLILCCPILLSPSIFPASGSFPMSWLFTSGGQSIGVSASASVLPMNILVWSPCSPRDSQESSPVPQFKSINSSVLSLFLWSNSHISYMNIGNTIDVTI